MPHFTIISASVRDGRKSHRVALFLESFIASNNYATTELLDLEKLDFPLFHERLKFQSDPKKEVVEFANKIAGADGVIIVTPEYNGGLPASLKNIVDLLTDEWNRKPIAISTCSNGMFGGSQVIMSLQWSLFKQKGIVSPGLFPVPKLNEAFDENGEPSDKEGTEKRAHAFLKELIWWVDTISSRS